MIYIGADHRGFELKEKAKKWLVEMGYQAEDIGALSYDKDDDYPDYAKTAAEKVVANPANKGILICGSEIGMAVAANKIKGIRAGGVTVPEQIKAAVNDDDINVLVMGADYLSDGMAKEIIQIFLETKFAGEERFVRRIDKIKKLEEHE